MEELSPEKFVEISFDIMEQVAEDFEEKKNELQKTFKGEYYELDNEIRNSFREILRKYERQLVEKYEISFSTYNQYATVYRFPIEEYLQDKEEKLERYNQLKSKLKPKIQIKP
jgi:uncharacterized protein YukE